MAWLQFRVSEAEGGPAPRECHTMLTVDRSLVIFGGNDSVARRNDLHIFDTDTMRWSTHVFEPPPPSDAAAPPPPAPSPDVPSRRSAHAAVMVDARYMLIFGGWDGAHELGDSYAYDLATHKWRRLATTGTPPAARHFHNCVIVGRKVLVFGGFDGQAWRSDLHSLDIDTLRWEAVNPASRSGKCPGARASACCGVLTGGRIFFFGGYDGTTFLRDAWMLHTQLPDGSAHFEWEELTPQYSPGIPEPVWPPGRSGHACEVLGDYIIMVGGRFQTGRFSDTFVYNTTTAVWAKVHPQGEPFRPRKTHAVGRIGTRLFLFGGHDGETWLGDMHILDLSPIIACLGAPLTITTPPPRVIADLAAAMPVPPLAPGVLSTATPPTVAATDAAAPVNSYSSGISSVSVGPGGMCATPAPRAIYTCVPHPPWNPRIAAEMIAASSQPPPPPATADELPRQVAWPLLSNAVHVPGLSVPSAVQLPSLTAGGEGPSGASNAVLLPAGYGTVGSEPPSGLPVVGCAGSDLVAYLGALHRNGDAIVTPRWRACFSSALVTPVTSSTLRTSCTFGAALPWYVVHPVLDGAGLRADLPDSLFEAAVLAATASAYPANPLAAVSSHSSSAATIVEHGGMPVPPFAGAAAAADAATAESRASGARAGTSGALSPFLLRHRARGGGLGEPHDTTTLELQVAMGADGSMEAHLVDDRVYAAHDGGSDDGSDEEMADAGFRAPSPVMSAAGAAPAGGRTSPRGAGPAAVSMMPAIRPSQPRADVDGGGGESQSPSLVPGGGAGRRDDAEHVLSTAATRRVPPPPLPPSQRSAAGASGAASAERVPTATWDGRDASGSGSGGGGNADDTDGGAVTVAASQQARDAGSDSIDYPLASRRVLLHLPASLALRPRLPNYADVVLRVEGCELAAHRFVLAARCDFFRALFAFAAHDAAPALHLPESSLAPFTIVLRFLYTDELPCEAEMRAMAADVMAEAQRLHLQRLSLACQRFLEASLAPSTVLPLLEVAEATGAEPLMSACLRFAAAHFEMVCLEEHLTELPPRLLRQLQEVVRDLRRDPLNVHLPQRLNPMELAAHMTGAVAAVDGDTTLEEPTAVATASASFMGSGGAIAARAPSRGAAVLHASSDFLARFAAMRDRSGSGGVSALVSTEGLVGRPVARHGRRRSGGGAAGRDGSSGADVAFAGRKRSRSDFAAGMAAALERRVRARMDSHARAAAGLGTNVEAAAMANDDAAMAATSNAAATAAAARASGVGGQGLSGLRTAATSHHNPLFALAVPGAAIAGRNGQSGQLRRRLPLLEPVGEGDDDAADAGAVGDGTGNGDGDDEGGGGAAVGEAAV